MEQPTNPNLESSYSQLREETESSPLDVNVNVNANEQPRGFPTTEASFQTIPLLGNAGRSAKSHHPLPTLSTDLEFQMLGKLWRPPPGRAHGWSEAERKHEMQARLLDVEEGANHGFTERE